MSLLVVTKEHHRPLGQPKAAGDIGQRAGGPRQAHPAASSGRQAQPAEHTRGPGQAHPAAGSGRQAHPAESTRRPRQAHPANCRSNRQRARRSGQTHPASTASLSDCKHTICW